VRYSLSEILSDLPPAIRCDDVIDHVNRACGIPRDGVPSPLVTYGWSEIYDGMTAIGYVADGKGWWNK